MALTHEELHAELLGLADSLDTHVTRVDAYEAISALAYRVAAEGLETPGETDPVPFDADDRTDLRAVLDAADVEYSALEHEADVGRKPQPGDWLTFIAGRVAAAGYRHGGADA
ncbi:hypothetical protein QE418_003415 [Microbacterium testaceum]|uniref:hypothetical protein n=1 Tax=Microbacterium TaxID=33882 RepID=UPI00277F62CE|nr:MULTISPECIES: hypothetical protein [Microbacterium]MDQ1113967.1 hypothetical protein [Microbacterium testaceum]MDR6098927.1 hypothetical protein [Microbacterium sp. SORGH_AS_0454]